MTRIINYVDQEKLAQLVDQLKIDYPEYQPEYDVEPHDE